MLRAITAPALDGVPDLVDGFEQRLGLARGEDREESRRRVGRALEGRGRLLLLKQVHGAAVAVAPWEERPEADAAVATGPRLLLGIETADCLPILIVDPRRRPGGPAGRPRAVHRSLLLRGRGGAARGLRARGRRLLLPRPARPAPSRRARRQPRAARGGRPAPAPHPPRPRLHGLPGGPVPLLPA